jgi:diguanylate cyclase (GGDEF)-like protein
MDVVEVQRPEGRGLTRSQFGWTEVAVLLVALGVGDAAYGFASGTAGAVAPLVGDIVLSLLLGASVFALGLSRARSRPLIDPEPTDHRGDTPEFEAMRDPLTGLPNRALIMDRIEQLLARNRRNGSVGAALYLDLDDFATINDLLGRASGDQLLAAVAARLTSTIREADTIGRIGDDAFVVLIDGSGPLVAPELVAERVLEVMKRPFMLERSDGTTGAARWWQVGLSIGIAVGERNSAEALLGDAEVALRQAKEGGKGRSVFFHPEMQTESGGRTRLEFDLRSALAGDQFRLVYLPIHDLGDLSVVGAEALLRWQHPADGLLAPEVFLPILEESGLIHEVGVWVLNEACRQMAAWHTRGDGIQLSVNLSGRQLEDDRIVEHIRHALHSSGLDPAALRVEVTESDLMMDVTAAATDTDITRRLSAIADLGVGVSVDDFGTGYCSLEYLEHLPVDCIKIDRSVITSMATSPEARVLVRDLVAMGREAGLQTLAEGVETADELHLLRIGRVDQAQGFHLTRPLEVDGFERELFHPNGFNGGDGPPAGKPSGTGGSPYRTASKPAQPARPVQPAHSAQSDVSAHPTTPTVGQNLLEPPGPDATVEVSVAMEVCEPHEAALWSAAFGACSELPDDPLGARVQTVGDVAAAASRSLDFPSLNRVLGFATPEALTADRIDEILDFYATNGVTNYRFEIPEPLLDEDVIALLKSRGLAQGHESIAKIYRTQDVPDLVHRVAVRKLGPDDRSAYAQVNRRAWGLPRAFASWYLGSFDVPDLHHFGVEADGELVAVGSLYVTGELGWLGYDAVAPGAQGNGYQSAVGSERMRYARELGCRALHGETRSEVNDAANYSLRAAPSRGFAYAYNRFYYEPVAAGS